MRCRLLFAVLAVFVVSAGCSGGDDDASSGVISDEVTTTTTVVPAPASTEPPATTATTTPETVTTGPPTDPKPPTEVGVPAKGVLVTGSRGVTLYDTPGGERIGRLREDITVAYDAIVDDAWVRVLTPCENRGWARFDRGAKLTATEVVIDAGHGGGEPGAVGPSGLKEKDLNLDIAYRVVRMLDAEGVDAVLTRRTDYRVTLASRVAIAAALEPKAFISIHHNAEPDEVRTGPGSETYYQVASNESKRLSGLLYEEIVAGLAPFPAEWMGDRDAGAKTRLNLEGRDYYGILRRSFAAGIPTSLVESAFISNPTEEALLRRKDVREAEAAAITRGLLRFLRGNDPGSGYVEAYVRHAPAGSGGGTAGCVDPS